MTRRGPETLMILTICLVSACTVNFFDRQHDGATRDGTQGDISTLADVSDSSSVTPGCGNGELGDGETCDIAIASGEAGACPESCDDGLACTTDTLENSGSCRATCDHIPVSACVNGDGCCPGGCDATRDDDCSKDCGNGKLDDKEICDTKIPAGQPGACVTSCDDGKSCTKDALLNPATCTAQCTHNPITSCKNGDGCCPTGCNTKSDDDCSPSCGNGVKDGQEKCDKAIAHGQPGACPTSDDCDDHKACTKDALLNAGTCNAQCANTTINQCQSSDGCCPNGCTNNNDKDCSISCGNGAVESGERCDKAIPAGHTGACPTSCGDGKACTKDALQNGGSCAAFCTHTTIQDCVKGDGCCPNGCNNTNDSDCPIKCGNGVVESGERCDGNCPSSCPGQTCKNGVVKGVACQRYCGYEDKTNGTACTGGTCQSGSCCTGCASGVGICSLGTNLGACGKAGAACKSCDDMDPCTTDSCSSGTCSHTNNTATCPGGTCHLGSCCTGCWNGTTCQMGTISGACGSGGSTCDDCSSFDSACEVGVCSGGHCSAQAKTEGTPCSHGRCYQGGCCTGCWDDNSYTCEPGNTNQACGHNGVVCFQCTGNDFCVGLYCDSGI